MWENKNLSLENLFQWEIVDNKNIKTQIKKYHT
jgi:hypothetical protein